MPKIGTSKPLAEWAIEMTRDRHTQYDELLSEALAYVDRLGQNTVLDYLTGLAKEPSFGWAWPLVALVEHELNDRIRTRALALAVNPVEKLMWQLEELPTVAEKQTVSDAVAAMLNAGRRYCAVRGKGGELVGYVTYGSLQDAAFSHQKKRLSSKAGQMYVMPLVRVASDDQVYDGLTRMQRKQAPFALVERVVDHKRELVGWLSADGCSNLGLETRELAHLGYIIQPDAARPRWRPH